MEGPGALAEIPGLETLTGVVEDGGCIATGSFPARRVVAMDFPSGPAEDDPLESQNGGG